jgi:hypothetical protein
MLNLVQCGERDRGQTTEKYDKPENPYLATYAGGYTIEVKGLGNTRDVELYVLADNGKAQWMLLKTGGRKEPEIMTRKYGTWTATDSSIKISIDGNSGQLIEEYVMKSGVFYNKESSDRYLKRPVN